MIRIKVTGQTYEIRQRLKDQEFRWNPNRKEWTLTVCEGSLDHTINELRPMRSWNTNDIPEIYLSLQSVDIDNNPMSEVVRIKLLDVERPGVSVLDHFSNVSDIHVSPVQTPGPITPGVKKGRRIDDEFF